VSLFPGDGSAIDGPVEAIDLTLAGKARKKVRYFRHLATISPWNTFPTPILSGTTWASFPMDPNWRRSKNTC
jgi:hypothetical protein